jgi:hypothetical protein
MGKIDRPIPCVPSVVVVDSDGNTVKIDRNPLRAAANAAASLS